MAKKETKKDFFVRITTVQLILFTAIFLTVYLYARFSADKGEALIAEYLSYMEKDMSAEDFKALFVKEDTEETPPAENTTAAAAVKEEGTTNVFAFEGSESAEMRNLFVSEDTAVSFLSAQISAGPVLPVSGRVSSSFGGRISPIYNYSEQHKGVDIAAASGTPIKAVMGGVVSDVDYTPGRGNFLIIDHGETDEGSVQTLYQHCSEILVAQGTVVRAGETIALVGSTGDSTGPHLHLEYRVDGECRDPMQLFTDEIYAL
ncbi:MAG: M23 family metallopeptidase [Clostridia bacterium]|nr:M23 family metallopeptidase [Clostridia bacterium]